VENGGQLLSAAQGNQDYLQISSSGNDVAVTWRDGRSYHSYPDYSLMGVYAQKLNGAISSVPDQPEVCPANLVIKTCYPNPFTDAATMVWEQKANIPAEISVYNLKGQLVKRFSSDIKASGEHSFIWNGKDAQDRKVSSGIYFIRVQCGKYSQSKKLVKL
jgi:hypothetical protein